MAERISNWSRISYWTRIPILVLAVAAIVWQLFRLLPFLVEDMVESRLLEQGVVVTAFPVEGIGYRGLRVGQGRVLVETNVLGWDGLWVGYTFGDLMAGRIDRLSFDRPSLALDLGHLLPIAAVEEPPPPSAPPPSPDAPLPEAIPAPPAVPGADAGVLPPPAPPARPLHERLLHLPLSTVAGRDGVVEFLIHDEPLLRFSLDGRLESQPYGTSGEVVLENDWMALEASLRVPASQGIITLQADAVMPPGALTGLQARLQDTIPYLDGLPQVVSSGPVAIDLFLEMPETGEPYGSAQTSVQEIALRFPFIETDLVLNQLLLAGTLQAGEVKLQGGAEILPLDIGDFHTGAFGMRFSARGGDVEMETEAFNWNFGDLAGRGAARGSAHPGPGPGGYTARMEASLASLHHGRLRADPFSLLAETDGAELSLKASPVGLILDGTLWVENLAAYWNFATASGEASLDWYNLLGQAMGTVRIDAQAPASDNTRVNFDLLDTTGRVFLAGHVALQNGLTQVSTGGDLPANWLDALNKWGKFLPVGVTGPAPVVDVRLAGPYPFLSGSARIALSGLNLELQNGTRLVDIRGDTNLQVNLLPRADEPQRLEIAKVVNGRTLLSNVKVEWDMPHIRNLRIRQLTGDLTSGRMRADPFELDPADPAFRTTLHFEGMDANLLLELLGEKRFTILGAVTGRLELGWKQDTLLIGRGDLVMEAGSTGNRFLFSDQAFLKERFAAFGGVPAEIKGRFLDALLKDGIRIQTLEATLGPASEPGKVLLRIAVSGETRTDQLEVPIKGFVINNLISGEDLGRLLGVLGNVKIRTLP